MLKFRRGWLGVTLLYCAFIFYLSSRPDLGDEPPWWLDWPQSDKFVHLSLFGGLAGLVAAGLLHSNGPVLSSRALFWVPIAFATLYGLSDEFHQWFVPPRSPDAWDLLADATGASMVAGIFVLLRPVFGNRRAVAGD